jgi:hypothetical protein
MEAPKKKSVTIEEIYSAVRDAAERYLAAIAATHPDETLYAFLFEISCEGFSVHGAVATEEGIARYAQAQLPRVRVTGKLEPLATVTLGMRWAGPEDGWYQQPDATFDVANELLRRAETESLYQAYDGSLNNLCLQVLRDLDNAHLFGSGQSRENVVIGICYIGGDNSDEEFLAWAKKVNSPSIIKRLEREIEESRNASECFSYF